MKYYKLMFVVGLIISLIIFSACTPNPSEVSDEGQHPSYTDQQDVESTQFVPEFTRTATEVPIITATIYSEKTVVPAGDTESGNEDSNSETGYSVIQIDNVQNLQLVGQLEAVGEPFYPIAKSFVSNLIAAYQLDGKVSIIDLETMEIISTMPGSQDWVMDMAFSRDDRLLVAIGFSGSIQVWDLEQGIRTQLIREPDLHSVVFGPDSVLYTGNSEGLIKSWNPFTGEMIKVVSSEYHRVIFGLDISLDGSSLVIGTGDPDFLFYDLENNQIAFADQDFLGDVHVVRFSPDNSLYASAAADGQVKIVRTIDHEVLFVLPHSQALFGLDFSPDGSFLVAGMGDGKFVVWSTIDGRLTRTIQSHSESISDLQVSPDGKFILTCAFDGKLNIWGVSE